MALGELQIEWMPVPDTSPAIGATLAECGLRARTGVTVIAILREPEPVSGAQPERRHPAGGHARRGREGRAVRRVPAAPRRGPVRASRPPSRFRRSRPSASIGVAVLAATSRRTRSAFSISSPGSSTAMSSGVQSRSGSLGPPTPSVRFVRSWPTKTNVPPVRAPPPPARARHCARRPGCGGRGRARGRTRRGLGLVVEQIGARRSRRGRRRARLAPRLRDRDLREVDAGDVPAERREPDRVLPLAAREVERSPRVEVLGLRDEEAVRLDGPEVLDLGVAPVPVLTLHGASAFRRRGSVARA